MKTVIDPKYHDYYERLGSLVLMKRKQTGLKQKDFAKKCGVSRSTISALESGAEGRTYTLDTIFRISDVIGMKPVEMFAFTIPEGEGE